MSKPADPIQDFVDATVAWAGVDYRTIKANILTYDPIFAREWTEDHTIPMLHAVERKGLKPRTVARLLHDSPSVIRCLMQMDIFQAKLAHAGTDIYMKIFIFYADVLRALCREDIFAGNLTNRIHDARQVRAFVEKCRPARPDIARELGRLSNACYNLSYGLYSDMNPQLVYDNFGPYASHGKMFALRTFRNLRAPELWPESKHVPVQSIDIGALYAGVDLGVDIVTHAIYRGDQIHGLRGYWCVVDGKQISLDRLTVLRRRLERTAMDIYVKYKHMSFERQKNLYCHQKAWAYKKLYEALGLDWKPSSRILNAVRGKSLYRKWRFPSSAGKQAIFFQEVFDPRIEISARFIRK